MISIAENSFYGIGVSQSKNRLYFKFKGAWERLGQVPEFLTHVQEALECVTPGFTVVSDITELAECTLETQDIHLKAHKLLIEAGLLQLAEIHKLNSSTSELAILMADKSKISLNIFQSQQEAEAWLDEME